MTNRERTIIESLRELDGESAFELLNAFADVFKEDRKEPKLSYCELVSQAVEITLQ